MPDETAPIRFQPSPTVPLSIYRVLLPQEKLHLVARQLPIPLITQLAAAFGGLLAAVAVSEIPGIAAPTRLIIWILPVFLAVRLVVAAVNWPNYYIVVTDKRLLVVSGIINRKVIPFPLPDVGEVGFKQSWRSRSMSYGDLVISPAGGTSSVFDFIHNPEHFYLDILNFISPSGDEGG